MTNVLLSFFLLITIPCTIALLMDITFNAKAWLGLLKEMRA